MNFLTIVIFGLFLTLSFCQVIDPYVEYPISNSSFKAISGYYFPVIAYRNPNYVQNLYNDTSVDRCDIGTPYRLYNKTSHLCKYYIFTTTPVMIMTDHTNYIHYSFDMITWNSSKGYAFVDTMMGFLYVNITSSKNLYSNIRFSASMNHGPYNSTAVISDNITSSKVYTFNVTQKEFGLFVRKEPQNQSACEMKMYLNYTSKITKLNLQYIIEGSFALKGVYTDNYNISLEIVPTSFSDLPWCQFNIYYFNAAILSTPSNGLLFYNGIQITSAIFLNDTYDINFNGTVPINGYLSVPWTSLNLSSIPNIDVYNNLDLYTSPLGYFDPLVEYYTRYEYSTITFDQSFPFTDVPININLSTVNFNISTVETPLLIRDSTIIVTGVHLDLNEVNFTGSNQLNVSNGSISVSVTSLSGNLTLTERIPEGTKSYVIMNYTNRTGEFEFINYTMSDPDECIESETKYMESQLVILFSVKDECSPSNSDPNELLYHVVLPIIGGLVLFTGVLVIIILKVREIRRRILPNRDRTFFKPAYSFSPGPNGSKPDGAKDSPSGEKTT